MLLIPPILTHDNGPVDDSVDDFNFPPQTPAPNESMYAHSQGFLAYRPKTFFLSGNTRFYGFLGAFESALLRVTLAYFALLPVDDLVDD